MYITPVIAKQYATKNIGFKAQEELPTEKDLLNEARKGKLDVNQVSRDDGETLFQKLIKNNYVAVVSYITAKPSERDRIIDFTNNGISPLDYAQTKEMRALLISRGANKEKTQAAVKTSQPQRNNNAVDAREAAAKIYAENPIKVQPSAMQPVIKENVSVKEPEIKNTPQPIVEEAPAKVDYFDSFDEVEDNDYEETPTTPAKNESHENVEQSKVEEKEIKIPQSYSNYKVLKLTPDEPQKMDDIIGMKDIKTEVKENVIIPLTQKGAILTLKANNIDIPNGILVETPENMTQFVKAMSAETKMPVLQAFTPDEVKALKGKLVGHLRFSGIPELKENYQEISNKIMILAKYNYSEVLKHKDEMAQ